MSKQEGNLNFLCNRHHLFVKIVRIEHSKTYHSLSPSTVMVLARQILFSALYYNKGQGSSFTNKPEDIKHNL